MNLYFVKTSQIIEIAKNTHPTPLHKERHKF